MQWGIKSGQGEFAALILNGKKGELIPLAEKIIDDYRFFLLYEENKLLLAGFSSVSPELMELKNARKMLDEIAYSEISERGKIELIYRKMVEIQDQRIKTKDLSKPFRVENFVPSGYSLKEVIDFDSDKDEIREKIVHCKSAKKELFFILDKTGNLWKKYPLDD